MPEAGGLRRAQPGGPSAWLRLWWCGVLAVAAVCWPGSALGAEDDLITSRAWLADPSGQLSLADVQAGPWQAAPRVLSRGYTADTVWLRVTVNVPRADEAVVLRVRPSYLDEVRLYHPDPAAPGQWRHRDTGDRVPFALRDRASAALALVWHPHRAGEHTLYLRVRTTSTLMVSVRALSTHDAQRHDHRLDLFLIAYLSVMVGMGLWALMDHTLQPSRVSLWFLATQATAVVFAVSALGYMAALLPAAWSTAGDVVTSVSVCLSTMLLLGFYRAMLADTAPSGTSRTAIAVVMLMFPVQLLLIATGHPRAAVESNAMVATLVATPLVFWMVASSRQDGVLSRRVWWGVVSTQAVLVVVAMVPLLGWRGAEEFNLQASLVFGLSSALLMLGVLMMRSRRLRQISRRDRLQLDLVSQRLELAQQQRADQQQFLDMLGHELKTPLMTIRLAAGALQRQPPLVDAQAQRRLMHIDAAATAMNQVLERVLEANRLGDSSLPVSTSPVQFDALLAGLRATLVAPERLHYEGVTGAIILTDADLLRVILANLLDNACKYSPPGSPVWLTLGELPGHWHVCVRNALGPAGAPDAHRVFDKYHRAEEAKGFAGAGLGLWLGHNLAQRLGGTLSVRTIGDHVEFSLCLPLQKPL
ncbi:hypothetical protein GTZ97_00860 [Aquabacterium fontiphilum]|uniref:sensor histidine kinase n=1 Tax=Aquabacterium fontiphilum TaxID=450365 RepID=UPI0013786E78|nr:7TM-DISM domain-containing protein [Aquabacterium fontiphilum]NBD19221.1 hypothetical protein [Aquabacterium fontiphilum]